MELFQSLASATIISNS